MAKLFKICERCKGYKVTTHHEFWGIINCPDCNGEGWIDSGYTTEQVDTMNAIVNYVKDIEAISE